MRVGLSLLSCATLFIGVACKRTFLNASVVSDSGEPTNRHTGCRREREFKSGTKFVKLKTLEMPFNGTNRYGETAGPQFVVSRTSPTELKNALFLNRAGTLYMRWFVFPDENSDAISAYVKEVSGWVAIESEAFDAVSVGSGYLVFSPDSGYPFVVSRDVYANAHKRWTMSQYVEEFETKVQLKWALLPKVTALMSFFSRTEKDDRLLAGASKEKVITQVEDPYCEKEYLPAGNATADLYRRFGKMNSFTFWKENYLKPIARASAELTALMGLQKSPFDSGMSNLNIEFDHSWNPSGRVSFPSAGDFAMTSAWGKIRVSDRFIGKDVLKSVWQLDRIYPTYEHLKGDINFTMSFDLLPNKEAFKSYLADGLMWKDFQESWKNEYLEITGENFDDTVGNTAKQDQLVMRINSCINTGQPLQGETCPVALLNRLRKQP